MTAKNGVKNWLQLLAEACEQTSQAAVARRLGVSSSLVNQVLKGTYRGDLTRVEQLVLAHIGGARVDCPVLGDLPRRDCLKHQARPLKFAAANPTKLQLYRVCRGECPHSNLLSSDEDSTV